jgi:Fe-S cluster biogenesis protein NfuA
LDKEKLDAALDIAKEKLDAAVEKVRQGLKSEGGDIEVINFSEVVNLKDDVLYVRLLGNCETCPMSGLTLKNWVEKTFKDELPFIKAVKSIQS